MKKSSWAKIFGYVGASAVALGQAGIFGKYSPVALSVAAILSAFGVHQASNSDGDK